MVSNNQTCQSLIIAIVLFLAVFSLKKYCVSVKDKICFCFSCNKYINGANPQRIKQRWFTEEKEINFVFC